VSMLRSEEEDVRVAALKRIVADRRTINAVLAVLEGQEKGPDWLNPATSANLAIEALGELRAEEAVPALLQWLLPPDSPYNLRLTRLPPAGTALHKIGRAAVPGVVQKVLSTTPESYGRQICADLLVTIEGREGALSALHRAAISTKESEEKQTYASVRELIRSRYAEPKVSSKE